jgi:hypothetical protein
MKTLKAAAGIALLAFIFPAAALAHTGTATVSCTGANLSFTRFASGSNTVNYKLMVDASTAAQGTFKLNAAGGQQGVLAVPLALNDTHEVRAFAWWGPGGIQDGNTRPASSPALAGAVLHCPAAPPPPLTAPAPAPVVAAPGVPPPVVAPAPQPPQSAVLGETVRSAPIVRLAVQAACAARHVSITVAGRLMSQVRISVNGRYARTVRVKPGARSVTALVPLRRSGPAVQTVTTRVSFTNGAAPRRMSSPARRCSGVAVIPQFTG